MTNRSATGGLRAWLDLLRSRGELGVVETPISPDHDVAAVLERCDGRRAVHFRNVVGSPFSLAGNLVQHREHLAVALGTPVRDVADRFAAAVDEPGELRFVAAGDAPVLARRLDHDAPLTELPLIAQHDRDAGRYATSAVLAVTDPASGKVNLSINRLMVAGGRELRVLVLPGRLRRILDDAERAGHDLDVAILVGVDPPLILASQSPSDRALDDLAVAGALRREPLPVVPAPLSGITVPAEAEFLIEGRFRAGERASEGPFGEYPLTYSPAAPAPVIEVEAVRHAEDPIFQTILSGGREHFLAGGIPREARLLAALRPQVPNVVAARLTEGGSCRLHAVIALRDPRPGDATGAMLTAFAAITTVKLVIVVDAEIDIFDDEQVAWAVATRVQADRDLMVVPRVRGSSLDPSAERGLTAKAGIDATVPVENRGRHTRVAITPSDQAALRAYLAEAEQNR